MRLLLKQDACPGLATLVHPHYLSESFQRDFRLYRHASPFMINLPINHPRIDFEGKATYIAIREPELEIAARIGITPEAYQVLRQMKIERKQSMVRIVSDLIVRLDQEGKRGLTLFEK